MKYPYYECQECDYFDWDNAQDVVSRPEMACSYNNYCEIAKQKEAGAGE